MIESIKHRYTMAITLVLSVLVMCGLAFGGAIPQAYAADDDVVSDPVQRGGLEIYKYDAQTGLSYSQGGANLAGAKFTITNNSENAIVFKDTFGHYSTYAVGESWEVGVRGFDASGNAITDEDGNVLPGKSLNNVSYYAVKTAPDALPYGSYHVQERTGSFGYALVDTPGNVNANEIVNVYNNGEQDNMAWHNTGYNFSIESDGQKVTYKSTVSPTTRNKTAAEGKYTVSAASGAKGPGVFNAPLRGELHVLKQDFDFYQVDSSDQTPQGNGSLAGAQFKIYNANPFAVTFWGATEDESGLGHGTPQFTDANGDGWYEPGEYITTIVTNESGSASTAADALPYGTYKVIEDRAPEGYKAVTTPSYAYVGVHDVQANNWAKVQDKILRGGAAFEKKDDDLKASTPQGDAVLGDGRTGATITIWNVSKHDVYIYDQVQDRADGNTHSGRIKPGAVTRDSEGNVTSVDKVTNANIVATIQTNENGYAYIYGLPYGTYYAKETKPSTGYLLNEEWEVIFDIKGTQKDTVGNYIEITPTNNTPLYEKVIRGNIKGAKVDAETHEHSPLGAATLKGAKIKVQNVSRMPIVAYCDANGKPSDTHRTVAVNGTVATLTTDDNGYFEIKDLPYGTYKLTESQAPTGYTRDTNWVQYVQIREDGKTYMLTEYNEAQYHQTAGGATEYSALANQVIREDIKFSKMLNGATPMPGVIFKLQSNTTGEWHLLVTDEDGMLDTTAWMPDDATDTTTDAETGAQVRWRMHTYRTNISDAGYNGEVLTADVKYIAGHSPADAKADPSIEIQIDPSSVITWDQGYWFYGYTGEAKSIVNDVLSTLPYDTYTLTELRCDANKGLDLIERQVYINRFPGDIENLGTIDNGDYTPPETIKTVSSIDIQAVKSSNPADNTKVTAGQTITYTVSYENTLASEVASVQIRDYLPKGVTFVSAANDGAYVEGTNGNGAYVEWTTDAVPVGGKGSVSYTVKVAPNAPSVIVNQALYQARDEKLTAGDNSNSDPAGATNIVRHTTDGTPTGYSLVSEKTAEPAAGTEVSKDDTILYKIKITNNGDTASPALGIYDEIPKGTVIDTVTDSQGYTADAMFVDDNGTLDPQHKKVYPVGEGAIGWTLDPIPAGGSITVSFQVKVTDKTGYLIVNQASYGPNHGKVTTCFPNSTNTIEHPVLRKPEVSITKTSDVPDGGNIAAGNIITYTLTVTNNGIGNAENIPVWDYIGTGTHYVAGSVSPAYDGQSASEARPYVSWVIPSLQHDGGSATMTYQVRVDDTVEAGTVVNNTASVGGTAPVVTNDVVKGTIEQVVESIQSAHSSDPISTMDDMAISNTVTQNIVDPCANGDVEVVKTADPEDGSFIEPGTEVTYTVTWTNNGNTAVNGFGVRDAIPENTTFVPGSITIVDPSGVSASANGVSTEPDANANDGAVPAPPTPDSVVWTEVTTVGKVGQVDAEAVYDAVVWDRSTQSIPQWNEIRGWFETAQAGDELTFTVTNTAWYDMLWKAYVDNNDRVILLCHVIVDNLSNSVNYAGTDNMWANYDSVNNAVYAVQTQLAPGETASMSFTVIVNEDVANNTDIKNVATFGGGIYGAPIGDLPNESNETTHHVGAPQIAITKSVDKQYAADGDVITYTIEATNEGTATAHELGLYDEFLPYEQSGLFYQPGSYSVTGSDAASASAAYEDALEMTSNVFRARATQLAPGETITWKFSMIVDKVDVGTTITNVASAGTNVPDGDFDAQPTKSNEVSTIIDEPKLSITKSVDPEGPIAAGDKVTYTITVKNTSNVDTDMVGVYDAIPQGTTLDESSLSSNLTSQGNAVAAYNQTIAAGEEMTFSFAVVVDGHLTESNIVSNTATCGITDVVPTSPLPIASNPTSSTVVAPNIRLVKTSDPADGSFVAPGDEVTYTLTAYNDGETIARGVGVYDKLPTGITYTSGDNYVAEANAISALLGDIPAGQSKSVSFKATVDSGFYGNITNYGSWDYLLNAAPTRHSANKSNDVLLTSSSTVDLSVVKTQSPEDGSEVMPGDTIHYKVTAVNNGATNVEGFSMFDSAPAGTTYVEGSVTGGVEVERGLSAYAQYLKAGQSMTMEFDVTVDASASGMIVNEATWDYGLSTALTDIGPRMTNDVDAIVTPPEVTISKSSDPADGTPVAAGDVITYTITVANDTEANAEGLAIYDKLPANTTFVKNSATNGLTYVDGALVATGVKVDAGSTKSFTYKVKANEAEADTTITNQATCGFANETPTAALGTKSNTVTHIISKPDLRMVKTSSVDGNQQVAPGDVIEYTVTVYNDGNVNATGVGMYDAIPEGTTYVEGSLVATGGVEGDGYVASYVGDIAAGESATMKFSVQVDDGYYGAINNTASWDYLLSAAPTAPTANVSNNSGTTSGNPDISVVKTQDRTDGALATPLDTITYTVRATNVGTASAQGVGIYDVIPEGTTYVPGSMKVTNGAGEEVTYNVSDSTSATVVGSGDEAAAANAANTKVGAISAYAENLDKGKSLTITYTVQIDLGYTGEIVNQATWDWGLSAAPVNELARLSNDVDVVSVFPTIDIYKVQNPPSGSFVAGGDELTYTVVVKNNGEVVAHNVGIYDEAPQHTSYVEGSLSGDGEATVGEDGLLTIMAGDLQPGQSAKLTFKAEIDLGFTGVIHNRGLWVSPAATPDVKPIEGTESDETEANVGGGVMVAGSNFFTMPALINVVIPDGAASGWSNDTGDPEGTGDNAGDNGSNAGNTGNTGNTGDNGSNAGNTGDTGNTGNDNTGNEGNNSGSNAGTTGDNNSGNEGGNTNTGSDTPAAGDDNGGNAGDNTGSNSGNDNAGSSANQGSGSVPSYEIPGTGTTGDENEVLVPPEGNEGDGSNETHAIVVAPTVEFQKTSNPGDGGYVKMGDEITYTLTVNNTGQANANYIVVEDQIPEGLTLNESSIESDVLNASFADGTLVATGNVGAGKTATVTYTCTVNTDDPAELVNVAKIAQDKDGDIGDDDPYTESNGVTIHAVEGDITLIKSADPIDGSYIKQGEYANYTVEVANNGKVPARPVVKDVLDSNLRYADGSVKFSDDSKVESFDFETASATLTVACKELAPGESFTITFKAKVLDEAAQDTKMSNKASWTDADDADNANAGDSNEVILRAGMPIIQMTKSSEPADGSYVREGDTVHYVIAVDHVGELPEADEPEQGKTDEDSNDNASKNAGNNTEADNTNANAGSDEGANTEGDKPEAGAEDAAGADANADGDNANADAEGDGANADADAQANGDEAEGNADADANDDANADGEGDDNKDADAEAANGMLNNDASADDKTSDEGKDEAKAGTEETPSIIHVVVLDEIPEGLSIDEASITATGIEAKLEGNKLTASGDISKGDSATIEFDAVVTAKAGTDIVNVAKAGQNKIDDKAVESNDTVIHVAAPEMSLIKSVSPDEGSYVKPGDELTYTLEVTNSGKVSETSAITDVLDKNVRYVDGSLAFSDESKVESYDFETSNATLSLTTKELAPGESFTATFKVKVADNVEAGSVIKNTAAWADSEDEDAKGDSNEVEVTVGEPNIVMSKEVVSGEGAPIVGDEQSAAANENGADEATTDDNAQAEGAASEGEGEQTPSAAEADGAEADAAAAAKVYAPGDEVTYQITVGNTGTMAGKVNFSDTLPEGATYVDGTLAVGSESAVASFENGTLTYENTLEVGATDTITYTVKVDEGVYNTQLVNAVVYKVDDSKEPADDQPTVVIKTGAPDVQVAKAADTAKAVEGDTVTYKISATNAGDIAANGVVVTDEFPAGLTYVDGSAKLVDAEGTADEAVKEADLLVKEGDAVKGLSYNVGMLKPGETSKFLTFQMTVNEMDEGAEAIDATNIAKVTDSTGETKESEPVVVNLDQKPEPNLAISKEVVSSDENLGVKGAAVKYQITLSNSGNAAAENVAVKDLLPAGLTLDDSSKENKVGETLKWVKDAKASTDAATVYNYHEALTVPAAATETIDGKDVVTPGTVKLVFVAKTTAPLNGTLTNKAIAENVEADVNVKFKIEDEAPVIPDPKPADIDITKKLVSVNGKSDTKLYKPGDKLTYEITATNSGDVAASGVEVYDVLGYYLVAEDKSIQATPAGELLKNKFAIDDNVVKTSGIDTSLFSKAQAAGGTVNTTSKDVLGVGDEVTTCMDDSFMSKGYGWVAVIGDTDNDGKKDSIEIAYVSTKDDGSIDYINEYWFGSYAEPVDGKFVSAPKSIQLRSGVTDKRWSASSVEFTVSGDKLSFSEPNANLSHSLSMYNKSQTLTWTNKNAQAASKTPVSAYVWHNQTIGAHESNTYTISVYVADKASGTIDNGAVANDKSDHVKGATEKVKESTQTRQAAEELGKTGQTIAIYVLVGAGLAAIIAGAVVLLREQRKRKLLER